VNQGALQQAIVYLDQLPPQVPLEPHLIELAAKIGCHPVTLRRNLQRYRDNDRHFQTRRRGTPWNAIPEEADQLITGMLLREYFRAEHPDLSDVARDIQAECSSRGWSKPSYTSIRARMLAMRTPQLITRRNKRQETARLLSTPGLADQGDHPLHLIATDHSPLDLILVHPITRLALGRAILTLVFCTCSRMILGFLVSFQKPSITSIALALSHAVLSKDQWLRARGIDPQAWPVHGLPAEIQVDNGREFHSAAFESACDRWNIRIRYRRKRRPRDGSLMENILGTTNRFQHAVPGTTFSNPRERQRYPSEAKAILSLQEFEVWFTHKVISYNHRRHRTLGRAPQERWNDRDFTLRPVHDAATFTLDFLPQADRVVESSAIELFTEKYQSEELTFFNNRHVLVKYDPLDLSHIWVYDPSRQHYFEVPYRDPSARPKSYWTYLAERRERTKKRDPEMEAQSLSHHRQAKGITTEAEQRTRVAKWSQTKHVRSYDPPALAPQTLPVPVLEPVEWPADDADLEPWPTS